jgi:hypothetical protein
MPKPNATQIQATFKAHPDMEIALDVAIGSITREVAEFGARAELRFERDAKDLLRVELEADSPTTFDELFERLGPPLALLSKSANLISLDMHGDVSPELKQGLAQFHASYLPSGSAG